MPPSTQYIEDINQFLDQFTKKEPRSLFFQLAPHQITSESKRITQKECQKKIQDSLFLLKTKAPNYYALFCLFNKKIRVIDGDDVAACANYVTNTIDYSWKEIRHQPCSEIAAGLVHETIHFWQRETGQNFISKQEIELEALRHEIQVLKLVGANPALIRALERERGTHWKAPSHYSRMLISSEEDVDSSSILNHRN